MWPSPQFPTDLVTFTEETLNRKLHFLAQWFLWIWCFVFVCFIIYFNQILWWCSNSVNSFLPSDSFWSPWKHQKTFGFFMFLGGLKRIIGKKRFKIEQFAHILIFVIYLLYIYYLFIYLFIIITLWDILIIEFMSLLFNWWIYSHFQIWRVFLVSWKFEWVVFL